jgi:hypothetical protein
MATEWKWGVQGNNVNKHRSEYSAGSGVKGAVEESKWGYAKARERTKDYGGAQQVDMRPKDRSMPQDPEAKRGPDWKDDHPNDWVRGFGKGGVASAEGKPNFDPGYRPGKKR